MLDKSKYSKSEVGFHFNIFCIEEKVMQKYNGYHTRLVFGEHITCFKVIHVSIQ